MADSYFVQYSDKKCWAPLVCTVDDAWFEGGEVYEPIFTQMGLGGIAERPGALSELVSELSQRRSGMSSGDSQYLFSLARVCQKYGFTLGLSNFEALREFWDERNSRGTAILLDINYEKCPIGETATRYGLHLIHSLLKGRRPYADIFLVTGGSKAFSDELSERGPEPSWWPIRRFPLVCKEVPKERTDALDKELECFAKYFLQGNVESPLVELLRTFVRTTGEDWSHPEQFDKVPGDVAFRNLYEDDCEAIKALYHDEESWYTLPLSVVASLLSTSGFTVVPQRVAGLNVVLPRRPFGILWLAQTWDLLFWLLEDAGSCREAALSCAHGTISLTIPLNPENSDKFHKAFRGEVESGMAVSSFRAMRDLRLRDGLFKGLKPMEQRILNDQVAAKKAEPTSEYQVDVIGNEITIKWRMAQ